MSKEQNRGMIDAYQKMLQDGTAFKEVDTTMHNYPSLAEAEGAVNPSEPLGEKVKTPEGRTYHNDYTEYDNVMEQKVASLRAKMGKASGGQSKPDNKRMKILEKKVATLEEALALVMETHEHILDKLNG